MVDGPHPTPEQLLFSFHRHWISMVSRFATAFVLTALILTIGLALLPPPSALRQNVVLVCGLLLAAVQLHLIAQLLNYFLSGVIVTDRRIRNVILTLVLTDKQQSIEIDTLQDIEKIQRGFFPSLLGYGTLTLRAENTNIDLPLVPHMDRVYEELLQLQTARKREMHQIGH